MVVQTDNQVTTLDNNRKSWQQEQGVKVKLAEVAAAAAKEKAAAIKAAAVKAAEVAAAAKVALCCIDYLAFLSSLLLH